MHPSRLSSLFVGFILVSVADGDLYATDIELTNNGLTDITVSDLTVSEGSRPDLPRTLILLSGKTERESADDIVLKPGQKQIINHTSDGKAIPFWRHSTVSVKDGKGNENTYEGPGLDTERVASTFRPDTNRDLFVAVSAGNSFVPEGQQFSLVGGANSSLAGYLFSETPFTLTDDGQIIGATPFAGLVTSEGNFQVQPIPEPRSLMLMVTGMMGLLAYRFRHAIGAFLCRGSR